MRSTRAQISSRSRPACVQRGELRVKHSEEQQLGGGASSAAEREGKGRRPPLPCATCNLMHECASTEIHMRNEPILNLPTCMCTS
eukprot:scaffold3639_cov141-Isochrysis_galbana.AAC.12